MKKTKYILILIAAFFITFGLSNFVFADDTEEITYTREFPAKDGTIQFNFSGLDLDTTASYKYNLTVGSDEPNDSLWMDLTDFTANTTSIRLEGRMGKFTQTMAKSNYGKIWIKKSDEDNSNAIKIDVDLTPQPESIVDIENSSSFVNGEFRNKNAVTYPAVRLMQLYLYHYNDVYGSYTGYLNQVAYNFQKINDSEIVEKWLEVKNAEGNDFSQVYQLINTKMTIPTSGYTGTESYYLYSSKNLNASEFTKREDGLYVIYIQYRGENYKTVYGYLIYDGMYNTAKTLEQYSAKFDNANNNDNNNEIVDNNTLDNNSDNNNDNTVVDNKESQTRENTPKQTTSNQKQDTTTASGKIPYTGVDMKIIAIIIIVSIVGIITYLKYRKFKNI